MSKLLVLLLLFSFAFFEFGCNKSPCSCDIDDPEKNDPEEVVIDTTSNEYGELYVAIDFGKYLNTLGKRLVQDRSDQVVYKIENLSLSQFRITNLSTKKYGTSSYPIDSTGKCNVEVIKIPRGYLYSIFVNFSGKIMSPWFPDDSSYGLNNIYFSGIDTIDLKTKSKDTLSLVLSENHYVTYFVSIENPQGKYTAGKTYSVIEDWNTGPEVKAVYLDGKLNHRINCQNNDTTLVITLIDDTGEVSYPIYFDINSVLDDDVIEAYAEIDTSDTVEGDSGSIYIGTITFEYLIPVKLKNIIQENGGISIYYNRSGEIYVDDSSSLKIQLGSDTTNLALSGEVKGLKGHVSWMPENTLESGTYTIEAKDFLDEYGNRTPSFKEELIVP